MTILTQDSNAEKIPHLNKPVKYCIVCGFEKPKKHWRELLRCPECGFVWADLDITENDIRKIYEGQYFFGDEYIDYIKERPWLEKGFKLKLDRLLKFKKSGRLLEVGCAYGFFLNLAKKHYDTQGIDISPDAVKFAQKTLGLNVGQEDLLSSTLPKSSFDIVVSWATVEHLARPDLYIEKISQLIKPGGIFACTTGDIEAPLPSWQKGNWRLIYPPTHLSYFSTRNLALLLKKNGLNNIHSEWLGEYRSIDNMLYMLFALKGKPGIYNFFQKLGLTRGGFYLNTFDIVFMIGQKS